jgi:serine/threonine protein phosphatase PrpC
MGAGGGGGVKITTWGASDVGMARKVNEDALLLAPELNLVAVADGMGGFQRGDVASQLACNVVREHIAQNRKAIDLFRRAPSDATRGAVKALLETAMQRACEQVHQAAVAITGQGGRMGTTFDCLLVVGTTAFIGHVGDARVYLQRGADIHQLTEDHSLVQQQIRDGLITREQARKARFKNVITRALGVFPSVLVDTAHFELDVGDRVLMCSDGLYRYIGKRELGLALGGDVDEGTVSTLVERANERGGRDNITAVLCVVEPEDAREAVPPTADRMEVLRRADIFQYCTYRELMALCEIATQRTVGLGEALFREGDLGRECFVIVEGGVSIEKGGQVLAGLGPSETFGIMSFLDQPRRSADAIATERTTLLVLHRDHFLQLIRQDSELAAKIMWQLLMKLSALVRHTNALAVAETVTIDDLEPEPTLM